MERKIIMNKKWEIHQVNQQEIEKIQQIGQINKLLATILVNRGITEDKIYKFLNPKRNDFYNPYEMLDMERAVKRIKKAIMNRL